MEFSIQQGWLVPARQLLSPNCNLRPSGEPPSLLVIHNISLPPGEFGGGYVDALFTNRLNPQDHPYFAQIAGLEVSAHLLIDRQGRVTQYVNFEQRAWHAGASCWRGRTNCNDFSIGIELEGSDCQAFTQAQYAVLAQVIRALLQAYPTIAPDALVGHSDIAPGRKTDPGPYFDWACLERTLAALPPET
jgi:N-acetyl-anhydromuramoyl-L-alanine amidase